MGKAVTNKEFLKRIHDQVGDEYTPLANYERSNKDLPIRHNICGNIKMISPNHFLKDKRRCGYCYHKNSKSPKEFAEQFKTLAKDDYIQLTSYHRTHEKIRVKHNLCGTEYMVTPHAFLMGERCSKCYGNYTKSTEEFYTEVDNTTSGEYELKSEYTNSTTKVILEHKECGKTYKVTPHDFISGNRCPYCKQSKGEKLVQSLLDSLDISYEIQKVFPDCGGSRQRLPFDFYVEDLNLLIEYDGEQHYVPIAYYGGHSKLKDQMRRDNIKNNYAYTHGIHILRLPYTMSDIEVTKMLATTLEESKAESPTPKRRIKI